jgi:hypothetical protein
VLLSPSHSLPRLWCLCVQTSVARSNGVKTAERLLPVESFIDCDCVLALSAIADCNNRQRLESIAERSSSYSQETSDDLPTNVEGLEAEVDAQSEGKMSGSR